MIERRDYSEDVILSEYLKLSYKASKDLFYNDTINTDTSVLRVGATGYLSKYALETQERYLDRQSRAVMLSLMKYFVDNYTDSIFSQDIDWSGLKQQQLVRFMKSATPDGLSLENFMRKVSVWSEFLNVAILIDNFSDSQIMELLNIEDPEKIRFIPKSKKEELRLFPYCQMFMPEQIVNYDEDVFGNLLKIELEQKVMIKSKYFEEEKEILLNIYWDAEVSKIKITGGENNGKEITNEHNLGVCPVVLCKPKNQDKWLNMADAQRQIINWLSTIDESIMYNTIPFLAVEQDDMGESVENLKQSLNTKTDGFNLVEYKQSKPEWITKDLDDITLVREQMKEQMRYMKYIAGFDVNDENSLFQKSGKAMEYSRQALQEMLKAKADYLEKKTNDILSLVAKWEQVEKKEGEEVDYPDQYDIKTDQEKLEELQTGLTMYYDSKTYRKHLKIKGVQILSPDLDQKEPKKLKEIEKEIEKNIDNQPTFEISE